ncbi:hypothetical protein ACFWXK_11250 [Streptomyces sp. NPDC059070]|uniref:hypothetical protein n=1 Tax=Streptomyces sp. NPDC059070 TaxID=3346713 RepID=UPI003687BD02
MRPLRPSRGHAVRAGVLASAALTATTLLTSPAHADPGPLPPASSSCNPAVDTVYYDATAQVTPVVTDFLAVNITPGSTGQRTESLTRVDSVTTTVNQSQQISASLGGLFARVKMKVGFSVSTTTSSTTSSTVTNTWSFNQPGYYGLYRGTRRVDGQYVKYVCAQTGSTTGVWVNAVKGGVGTYTTYENPEIGTVVRNCVPEPAGSVRRVAQDRLGVC